MKRVVVLTGAGVSAESGLQTFRDGGGLWEGYNVQDVATPQAWERDPELVQRFYNERRKGVLAAEPNAAHQALASLDEYCEVQIVTQNIDNLHERAGSKHVLHLHGVITKAQSSKDPQLLYDIEGWELSMGETCEHGSQLRPHVVWFGEAVPMMEPAIQLAREAEVFLVIGTSLVVYPAASLIDFVPGDAEVHIIDLNASENSYKCPRAQCWDEKASVGVPKVVEVLKHATSH